MAESKEKQEKSNSKNEYENICFVMMPISDQEGYEKGHFDKIYEQIFKPAIIETGYKPFRVDENKISDAIIVKIFDAIQKAPMALCDLSSNNPNVLYELGLRQAYDKPVVLVKDNETRHIFDIGGINTIKYEKLRLYENVESAKKEITEAIFATKKDESKYSIVSLINANKALNENKISSDDMTQVMLERILNEINSLTKQKSQHDNSYKVMPPRIFGVSGNQEDSTEITITFLVSKIKKTDTDFAKMMISTTFGINKREIKKAPGLEDDEIFLMFTYSGTRNKLQKCLLEWLDTTLLKEWEIKEIL